MAKGMRIRGSEASTEDGSITVRWTTGTHSTDCTGCPFCSEHLARSLWETPEESTARLIGESCVYPSMAANPSCAIDSGARTAVGAARSQETTMQRTSTLTFARACLQIDREVHQQGKPFNALVTELADLTFVEPREVARRFHHRPVELMRALAKARVDEREANASGRLTTAEFNNAWRKVHGEEVNGIPVPRGLRGAVEDERAQRRDAQQQYRADGMPIPLGLRGAIEDERRTS